MKSLFTGSILTVALAAFAAAQPPQMPTPGAEQKRLAAFEGTWKMDMTMHPSPLGPGGKMTGTETCRMFEGWHLVCDSSSSGPMGAMKGHAVMTYDRRAKMYSYFSVSNMADGEQATGTISGNTWTWTGKTELGGGKSINSRFTLTETSPTLHNMKWEMSEDGKAWKVVMEGTSTKTS